MDEQLAQSEVSTNGNIENIDELDVSNLSMDHADELAEQELPNGNNEDGEENVSNTPETSQSKKLSILQTELQDLESQLKNLNESAKAKMSSNFQEYQSLSSEIQRRQQELKLQIEAKKAELEHQQLEVKKETEDINKAFQELPRNHEGIKFSDIQTNCDIAIDFIKKQNEAALNILDNEGTYQKLFSDFNRSSTLLPKDLALGLKKICKDKNGKLSKSLLGLARCSQQAIRDKIAQDNERLEQLKGNINQQNIRVFLAEYRDITGANFSCTKIQQAKKVIEKDENFFDKINIPKALEENKELGEAFGSGINLRNATINNIITGIIFEAQKSGEHTALEAVPYGKIFAAANETRNNFINEFGRKEGNSREKTIEALTETIMNEMNPVEWLNSRRRYHQLKKRLNKQDRINPFSDNTKIRNLTNLGINQGVDAGSKAGIKRAIKQVLTFTMPNRIKENNPNRGYDFIIPGRMFINNGRNMINHTTKPHKERKGKEQNSELPQVSPDENISTPSQEAIADV